MRRFLFQTALVVIIAFPAVARADNFTLDWADNTLTFNLPPEPIPASGIGNGFGFNNVAFTLNGKSQLSGDLVFFSPDSDIGGLLFNYLFYPPYIDQFFDADDALINDTTPDVDPFILGTHTGVFEFLSDYPATLVITQDASPVAEPSSLLLLATGVLGLGVAASRKSLLN
jgi:PEP-CTERM motif